MRKAKRVVLLALAAGLALAGCGRTAPTVAQAQAPATAEARGIFNKPVSVEWLLNDIMVKYDHNRNGLIELEKPGNFWQRLFRADERYRWETTRDVERDRQTGELSRVVYTTYTYARLDAFRTADANRDLKVTRQELARLLFAFDKDRNGELDKRGFLGWLTRKDKREHDLFVTSYGEELTDTARLELDFADKAGQAKVEQGSNLVDEKTPDSDLKSK